MVLTKKGRLLLILFLAAAQKAIPTITATVEAWMRGKGKRK